MTQKQFEYFEGGISDEVLCSRFYQDNLYKLQKHYGFMVVHPNFGRALYEKQSAWDKRGNSSNTIDENVELTKAIIAGDFAMGIHKKLADFLDASAIRRLTGSFSKWLKEYLSPKLAMELWVGKPVYKRLLEDKQWWLSENYD